MRPIDADALMEKVGNLPTPYGKLELLLGDSVRNAPTLELPRWIPVTERLPDRRGLCIAALQNGVVSQVHFETQGGRPYFWYSTSLHELAGEQAVTHWMPMPEPPKEE